jgi:tetratricopeptide (TPR) repeat protein
LAKGLTGESYVEFQYGEKDFADKKYQVAFHHYVKALNLVNSNDTDDAHLDLELKIAETLVRLDMATEALSYLVRIIHFEPENAAAYNLLARVVERLGYMADANVYYGKAKEASKEYPKSPEHVEAIQGLAITQSRLEFASEYYPQAASNHLTLPEPVIRNTSTRRRLETPVNETVKEQGTSSSAPNEEIMSELEFQLNNLLSTYGDIIDSHQWPSERLRFIELIYSLAWRIIGRHSPALRSALVKADMLGLLKPQTLTSSESQTQSRLSQVLREVGTANEEEDVIGEKTEKPLSNDEIVAIVQAIRDVSNALVRNYKGKIQIYLRTQGEQLLKQALTDFKISNMDEENTRIAFTFWYQNVLDLPLTLNDETISQFIAKYSTDIEHLKEAADKLDLNLALVDDLVRKNTDKMSETTKKSE